MPNKNNKKILDLKQFKCPNTFLYAKLGLEELKGANEVEILFCSKKECENVFESLTLEGYSKISKITSEEQNEFKLIVST